ncbi:DUF1622 domain-containing protein [Natronospira bacteriovora]|uniref:DUF1622 domain-containing protein n=1 Tax=Natronospira bacteriovora TaxID=3069753 RepID=A0ABU0W9T1_9GAMM|nr:DUF1622 domain-containing protein [Natronospira sp. AB-CW4]MDQ2070788.1 DUF1622 domain-containing protein [Natronospira sp. AB-CW4]
MSEMIQPFAAWCAAALEAVGVGIISLIALLGLVRAGYGLFKRQPSEAVFHALRQRLGRGILLGLEFLIAADIIHTVAVELTFESIGVLAAIVLIRTFLSFTLEVELSGRWPWQNHEERKSQ